MNKIEIPISRTKLILMLIGSLLFVIGGLYLAINPEEFSSTYRYRNPEITRIVGIITACFFSLVIFYIPKKLFDKKPGLIIDDKGIIDNSSPISVGQILWDDIISISTGKVQSTKFLIIKVKKPEKYLKNTSNFKKRALKANMRFYGTPLTISSNGLKSSFSNLERIIQLEFKKCKEKPNS